MKIIEKGTSLWGDEPLDPDDDLDFELDLTDWLTAQADTLFALTVEGTNCVAYNPTMVGMKARGWVKQADPTVDGTCAMTFHVTTTAGRKKDRTYHFKVKEN